VRLLLDCPAQVLVWLNWASWLRSRAASLGQQVVWVNSDETSLCLSYPGARGNIAKSDVEAARETVPSRMRRGALTYLATICSDPVYQKDMPQVFVVNTKLTTKQERAAMLTVCAQQSKTFMRFEDSSWMTSRIMRILIGNIAELQQRHADRRFVVVVDCAPCHLAADFMAFAQMRGVWLLLVPAGLTSLLQPLDRAAFGPFKAALRAKYGELRVLGHGSLSRLDWYCELLRGADHMRKRKWENAFASCGLGDQLSRMSSELQQHAPAIVQGEMPMSADLERVLPQGAGVHWRDLFQGPAGLRPRPWRQGRGWEMQGGVGVLWRGRLLRGKGCCFLYGWWAG
jgi:DDE superfamily endonuclease